MIRLMENVIINSTNFYCLSCHKPLFCLNKDKQDFAKIQKSTVIPIKTTFFLLPLSEIINSMNNYILKISLYLLFLSTTTPSTAQANVHFTSKSIGNSPKYEVRAAWLATIGGIDWPSSYASTAAGASRQKQDLVKILDQLQQINVNTVMIQARVRGTTIFPSAHEPWDACLTGKPGVSPGYDPLLFAIEECHKRGMECHAWIVAIPMGKWNGAGCRNLRQKRPELLKKIGDEGFLNPEHPQTANYLSTLCGEIVDKYDVDGIHLDYIRYPETWKINVPRRQGREHVSNIVRAIYEKTKPQKPWLKLSCAPIGKYADLSRYSSNGWNAYERVCQDAQQWLSKGWVDQLYPMMYFRDNQFFPFAINWAENAYGKDIVPGLGIYFLDPREGKWKLEDVVRQMAVLRQLDMGQAFFRTKFLLNDTKGIYQYLKNQFYRHPALVPPIDKSQKKPEKPMQLAIETMKGGSLRISWTGQAPYYNIYASEDYPVDLNNAQNLLIARTMQRTVTLNSVRRLQHFAITAVDRFGNESQPLEQVGNREKRSPNFLKNDGMAVHLPDLKAIADIHYTVIETLQGNIVATQTLQYTSEAQEQQTLIDVKQIPNGMYVLRSVNKKGKSHRLGYFAIKRKTESL